MTDAIATITAFLNAWGPTRDDLHGALRDYLADDAIWENVGLATTKGPDEAVALMRQFEKSAGIWAFKVDTLFIAAQGDVVLTERVDRRIDKHGAVASEGIRVMGVFEVRDGKIAAWRDYFDTAPFLGKK
jgi:limonene-1,2-epoxide hydrolase